MMNDISILFERRVIERHGFDKYGDAAIVHDFCELFAKQTMEIVIKRVCSVLEKRIKMRHGYDKHGDISFILEQLETT